MFRFVQRDKSQITSRSLFALNGFEQRFEIAFSETLSAFALNNLEKECRAIFHRFGENLKQITFVIAIDQDAEALQCIQFFVDVPYAIEQRVVVRRRNSQELKPALL